MFNKWTVLFVFRASSASVKSSRGFVIHLALCVRLEWTDWFAAGFEGARTVSVWHPSLLSNRPYGRVGVIILLPWSQIIWGRRTAACLLLPFIPVIRCLIHPFKSWYFSHNPTIYFSAVLCSSCAYFPIVDGGNHYWRVGVWVRK